MGGWRQQEVAIGVGHPPAAMVANALTIGERRVGQARHWAIEYRDIRLLVLRSSIPLRTTQPDPDIAAATIAANWWRDRLLIWTLGDTEDLSIWSWIDQPE